MADKKSSKAAPAGVGVAQPKAEAKAKVAFPRQKVAELQEALNHLTYFQEMLTAQESALRRLDVNKQICAKNVKLWTMRIEKLQEMTTNEYEIDS